MNTSNMRNVYLFDLDGTVIDSFHRVKPCLRPNGDLDLEMYINEACTHDKIMNDTLLPLADYMKQLIKAGETVCIVTARYMGNSDYYFLRKNGLSKGVTICSRDRLAATFGKEDGKRISALSDGEYKRHWFNHLWHKFGMGIYTMYDDHNGVLEVAAEIGFRAVNAIMLNEIAASNYRAGYDQGATDTATDLADIVELASGDETLTNLVG